MEAKRKLTALLFADVVGYSRLVGADEAGAVARVKHFRQTVLEPALAKRSGRLVKSMGDGFLAEFTSVMDATKAAVELQEQLADSNDTNELRLRIGVHIGDVILDGDDLLGDGVNVTARLQAFAEPGSVCLSADAYRQIEGKLPTRFQDAGEQRFKNIGRPVRVYTLKGPKDRCTLPTGLSLPNKPSIAVLPFKNMSGDSDQDYFCDGLVEDLITALSRFEAVFVIARNSSFTYQGTTTDVREIGRELGVRYILEGSVRKAGGRLRISGQLIEAQTCRSIWADRFDGELAEVFDLQDRITESVVGAIEPSLRGAEIQRARRKPTEELEAYDFYLLALASSYCGTENGWKEAQRLMLKAVAVDPSYSVAKAATARIVMIRKLQSWATEADVNIAINLAREALENNRDDPMVLRNAGHSLAFLAREFDLGLSALRRAVSISPNSAQVLGSSGMVHNYVGQTATAITHIDRAIRLSPLDPEMAHFVAGIALAYLLEGKYEQAREKAAEAMHLVPNYTLPYRIAAAALSHLGQVDEARASGRRLLSLTPNFRISSFLFPLKDAEQVKKWKTALRRAGLPE